MINLDNIKMNVVKTAENGVVNRDPIFQFTQKNRSVYATYSGGKIEKGFLVGLLNENELTFNFCQLQNDGILDNGTSTAKLAITENGKIRLTEHFEWKSRPGEFGVNIFEEL